MILILVTGLLVDNSISVILTSDCHSPIFHMCVYTYTYVFMYVCISPPLLSFIPPSLFKLVIHLVWLWTSDLEFPDPRTHYRPTLLVFRLGLCQP